jgi:hypothetical protein
LADRKIYLYYIDSFYEYHYYNNNSDIDYEKLNSIESENYRHEVRELHSLKPDYVAQYILNTESCYNFEEKILKIIINDVDTYNQIINSKLSNFKSMFSKYIKEELIIKLCYTDYFFNYQVNDNIFNMLFTNNSLTYKVNDNVLTYKINDDGYKLFLDKRTVFDEYYNKNLLNKSIGDYIANIDKHFIDGILINTDRTDLNDIREIIL